MSSVSIFNYDGKAEDEEEKNRPANDNQFN